MIFIFVESERVSGSVRLAAGGAEVLVPDLPLVPLDVGLHGAAVELPPLLPAHPAHPAPPLIQPRHLRHLQANIL